MNRSKIIAALTTVSLVTAAVSVAPTATAVQFYGEQRNDRSICVSQSTPNEVQVTKDYYQAQLDEYLVMQGALRAAFPEFSVHYERFDELNAQGISMAVFPFEPLLEVGFTPYEARFFAVEGTDTYKGLQSLVTTGASMDIEFAPEWTKAQMGAYPNSGAPVVPIGADWTMQQTSLRAVDAYVELTAGMPVGAFRPNLDDDSKLRPFVEARLEVLAPAKVKYDAVMSPTAVLWAAQSCLTLYRAGDLPAAGPVTTTTVTPTTTATAQPTTTTVTPAPTTTTVAPVTSTVTAPVLTTTTTPAPVTTTVAPVTSTVTAPVVTVSETPAPVTTTVAGTTTTQTEAPVTITEAPTTSTITAPVLTTTVTAPVVTVSETPAPVTTTVAGATTTVTEGPVTTTVQLPAETVTEVAPTVTVTVTPTATATDTPDPGDGGGNNFGMVAAIVAVLAAIGGIAAFLANNVGLFAGFF